MRVILIGIGVALASAGSASAGDRMATSAILNGDFVQAERTLNAERKIFPKRPELMLNLAAVYRETGRDAEARALYVDVLRRNEVLMDMVDERTMSSHAIARNGLNHLSQVAAR